MLAVVVWAWVCAAGVGWVSGECVAVEEGVVETVKGDAAITLLLPLHNGQQCDQVRVVIWTMLLLPITSIHIAAFVSVVATIAIIFTIAVNDTINFLNTT